MTPAPVDRRGQFLSIGGALVVASGLGFLLLGLVARWLTPGQNALFLSLWGMVFGFGSVLGSTEQEIARQSALARLDGRRAPASVLQWAGVALGGTGVALVVLAATSFGSLFAGSWALVGLTAAALVAFAGQFLARGVFLGGGRTPAYVAILVLEAGLRVVPVAVVLLLGLPPSVAGAVAAVVLGCWGWTVLAPRLAASIDRHSERQPWRTVTRRLGTLAGANALSSLVLTAFPTLATAVLGSSAELAVLFGVVTLSRVPLVLVSPLQAMVVPLAVEYLHEGRSRELMGLQLRGAALGASGALVLGVGGWLFGPWALRVFMGPNYVAAPLTVSLAMAASAVMALALLQAAVFIALERYSLVALTWGVAVASAVGLLVFFPGTAADRGLAAFVVATVAGYVTSGVLLRRSLTHHGRRAISRTP